MTTLTENYARIRDRLAGREPERVRLVAVSKNRPFPAIHELYELGHRDFGENRIEEAGDKIASARHEGLSITWHMIGHIQSRKAKAVVADFNWAHSVESASLAERLSRAAGEAGQPLPVLLECNVSGEDAKYGLAADRVEADPAQWAALCVTVEAILAQPHLQVRGLMTMAPIVPEPEQARPVFKKLRELSDRLTDRFPAADWRELSMGMTDDFEPAIEEGATMVRIGRAIFET